MKYNKPSKLLVLTCPGTGGGGSFVKSPTFADLALSSSVCKSFLNVHERSFSDAIQTHNGLFEGKSFCCSRFD